MSIQGSSSHRRYSDQSCRQVPYIETRPKVYRFGLREKQKDKTKKKEKKEKKTKDKHYEEKTDRQKEKNR